MQPTEASAINHTTSYGGPDWPGTSPSPHPTQSDAITITGATSPAVQAVLAPAPEQPPKGASNKSKNITKLQAHERFSSELAQHASLQKNGKLPARTEKRLLHQLCISVGLVMDRGEEKK